ncbi:MAG: hypothetical protein JWL63_585 [Rhodocyclales bacterium]|nr:hypothetical protein [Rhodocyclales bacterium]
MRVRATKWIPAFAGMTVSLQHWTETCFSLCGLLRSLRLRGKYLRLLPEHLSCAARQHLVLIESAIQIAIHQRRLLAGAQTNELGELGIC